MEILGSSMEISNLKKDDVVKVKIYDFDKTICDKDSIFYILKYIFKKYPLKFLGTFLINYYKLLMFWQKDNLKEYLIRFLSILPEEEKREFILDHIRKYGFEEVIETMDEEGYLVIICTASSETYMKYAKEILNYDILIATRHDDRHLCGGNNAKKNKLKNLEELFEKLGVWVDTENSKGYTDSYKNDEYMLRYTEQKYLINDKKDGFISIYTKELK